MDTGMGSENRGAMGAKTTTQKSDKVSDKVNVESLVADLIPWFLENRQNEIGVLEKAAENGDLEVTRHIGHTLKGTSGGYGFLYLGELGGQLEHESRAGNLARVKEIVGLMKQHLARVEITYVD